MQKKITLLFRQSSTRSNPPFFAAILESVLRWTQCQQYRFDSRNIPNHTTKNNSDVAPPNPIELKPKCWNAFFTTFRPFSTRPNPLFCFEISLLRFQTLFHLCSKKNSMFKFWCDSRAISDEIQSSSRQFSTRPSPPSPPCNFFFSHRASQSLWERCWRAMDMGRAWGLRRASESLSGEHSLMIFVFWGMGGSRIYWERCWRAMGMEREWGSRKDWRNLSGEYHRSRAWKKAL